MKRKIAELIQQKGLRNFKSISPQNSIHDALTRLEQTNSSALLVLEGKNLKGIFTEKDFARKALIENITLSTSVDKVMTKNIYCADPSYTLEDCLQIMSKNHIRHLPVMDGESPIALVSMGHIMEFLVDDKDTQIKQLTTYITGTGYTPDIHQNIKLLNSQHQEAL